MVEPHDASLVAWAFAIDTKHSPNQTIFMMGLLSALSKVFF